MLTRTTLLAWMDELTPDAITCPAELVETIQAAVGVPVTASEGDPWIRLWAAGKLLHCGSCSEWVDE